MADTLFYLIRIQGILDASWEEWFDGMTISPIHDTAETVLVGSLPDQAALYGLLNRLRDLNLPLIALYRLSGTFEQSRMHDLKEVYHVS